MKAVALAIALVMGMSPLALAIEAKLATGAVRDRQVALSADAVFMPVRDSVYGRDFGLSHRYGIVLPRKPIRWELNRQATLK